MHDIICEEDVGALEHPLSDGLFKVSIIYVSVASASSGVTCSKAL